MRGIKLVISQDALSDETPLNIPSGQKPVESEQVTTDTHGVRALEHQHTHAHKEKQRKKKKPHGPSCLTRRPQVT